MSLPEEIQKIKGFFRLHEEKVLTGLHILLLVGIGTGGYLIGGKEAQMSPRDPRDERAVAIFSPNTEPLPTQAERSKNSAQDMNNTNTAREAITIVASSKGTKYHRVDCSGAKTIKEENRIYFSSEQEAREAGYAPAANCPGLR